ncbi:hypothetical protein ABPG74_017247 [Tetrahymena malaccensis]
MQVKQALNVFSRPLQLCCNSPKTGFFRDGFCNTNAFDAGRHLVCVKVTNDFLKFSKERGNDLITPVPEFNFPGLKHGDCWCVCVLRWKEAFEAGKAPYINLEATHIKTLEYVKLDDLMKYDINKLPQFQQSINIVNDSL